MASFCRFVRFSFLKIPVRSLCSTETVFCLYPPYKQAVRLASLSQKISPLVERPHKDRTPPLQETSHSLLQGFFWYDVGVGGNRFPPGFLPPPAHRQALRLAVVFMVPPPPPPPPPPPGVVDIF